MRLMQLKIENFRGFHELGINFKGQSAVIFGRNGAGKSTILDSVAMAFSRLVRTINVTKNDRLVNDEDITNRKTKSTISVELEYDAQIHSWSVTKVRKDKRKVEGIESLNSLSQKVKDTINQNNEDMSFNGIPIAVYYPVNRVVVDIPLRIRNKHQFGQDTAFESALTSGADFRMFFEWFREQEDWENEVRLEYDAGYEDPQLSAVRRAVSVFLPDFENLRVARRPLRMLVDKRGATLEVTQLSDGEKCLLALVGDLARRLALANPGVENPLDGEGIVLIDEVELHLHPGWQRRIISGFQRTFPNIQFIISTHSPQVISEVRDMKLYALTYDRDGNGVELVHSVFGQDVNYVLEETMEAPTRNERVQQLIDTLFEYIADEEWELVDQLRCELMGLVEWSKVPELVKADVIITRKRSIGR